MRNTLRAVIGIALLVISATLASAQAQKAPAKPATGSISGRVIVGGVPRAGVRVVVHRSHEAGYSLPRGPVVATDDTDPDGRFRLSPISAGNYLVIAASPESVPEHSSNSPMPAGINVIVNEGEAVEGITLSLVKGGVITGKVTNADGWPVVGKTVNLERQESNQNFVSVVRPPESQSQRVTDDRGVFRMFGLPPGRYRVGFGDVGPDRLSASGFNLYQRVYYADTPDPTKATIIEIGAGTEIEKIDIKLPPVLETYTIRGKVIDAQTRRPVAGVRVENATVSATSSSAISLSRASDATGEFELPGVPPGRYVLTGESEDQYGEPQAIEISRSDLAGIEILVKPGGSISGIIVVEGSSEATAFAGEPVQHVVASSRSAATGLARPRSKSDRVVNRSFQIRGLRAGTFVVAPNFETRSTNLAYARTEYKGADITKDGIPIQEGEHLSGVRVVFTSASGSIEGKIVDVDFVRADPPQFFIFVTPVESGRMGSTPRAASDARGLFSISHVVPGEYNLMVMPRRQEDVALYPVKWQRISVLDGQPTRINIEVSGKQK